MQSQRERLRKAFRGSQELTPGGALRLYRDILGKTSDEVAHALGVSRKSYSFWENGHSRVWRPTLYVMRLSAAEMLREGNSTTWDSLCRFAAMCDAASSS